MLREVLEQLLLILHMLLLVDIRCLHEAGHDVYRYREDYGAVILSRYAVQCL